MSVLSTLDNANIRAGFVRRTPQPDLKKEVNEGGKRPPQGRDRAAKAVKPAEEGAKEAGGAGRSPPAAGPLGGLEVGTVRERIPRSRENEVGRTIAHKTFRGSRFWAKFVGRLPGARVDKGERMSSVGAILAANRASCP